MRIRRTGTPTLTHMFKIPEISFDQAGTRVGGGEPAYICYGKAASLDDVIVMQ